ncbi:hypothetical protein LTR37_003407 [Vermiconidia calcicola]|uniref:Uncharacterized protein n=1 Tax=Vermiconidia calcicola TaxID=1690605 RepID=A0ACC3NQ59_9PEZI|nr:hypothetical protein LTR37_003407 [Vermiconidia calcicola]
MDQPYASGHQPIANPLNHGNEQRFDTQHQFDNQVMNNSLNSAPSATGQAVRTELHTDHPTALAQVDPPSLKHWTLSHASVNDWWNSVAKIILGLGLASKDQLASSQSSQKSNPQSETTSAGHATATTASALPAKSAIAQDQQSSSTTSLTNSLTGAPVAGAVKSAGGQALPPNFFAPTYGYGDLEDILGANDLDE